VENMERPAALVVTSEHWDRMSALVNSVGAHGEVVAIDDPLERITLELAGIRLGFVVVGGNSLEPLMVMLLSINGQIVLADETAGLWEIHPRIGERITELFSRHGACVRCMVGEHGACLRQHEQGPCRCECGIDWALYRIRTALGVASPVVPDLPVAALTGAAAAVELESLPRRVAAERL
jgi:hypothetical protein